MQDEVNFLKKIQEFEFSDDEKLNIFKELAQDILREEDSVIKYVKECLNEGRSDSDCRYWGEEHRRDRREEDWRWNIPINYDGNRRVWIENRKKEQGRTESTKIQAFFIFLSIVIIIAIFV